MASSHSNLTISGLLEIADVNGDGAPDLLFDDPEWREPLGQQTGRVCVLFGPWTLPSQVDLLSFQPPTCIEAGGGHGLGESLHVADLDGDGIADVIVGSGGGANGAGTVAVFRGRTSWPGALRLADADWRFEGAEKDDWLRFGAVGDLNGDSSPDLTLFAARADGPANTRVDAGEGYIFFGPATTWTKTDWDLAIDAPDVTIWGADGAADNPSLEGDFLGFDDGRALVADLIGDATNDLVVVAHNGSGVDNLRFRAGEVYLLHGRATWPTEIDLRVSGAADLVVYGPAASSGLVHPAVGDWDGDGESDLIIGASGYSDPSLVRTRSGGVLVFRGRAGLSGIWDVGSRAADATIVGRQSNSQLGLRTRVADVNGDGFLDIITSSNLDSPLPTRTRAGTVFVVSGCAGFAPFRDLALQPAELEVWGADAMDYLGGSDLAVAEIDGDGRADIVVAAPFADSRGNLRVDAGEVHLIRGRDFAAPVCSIAADAGAPIDVCGLKDTLLDASGSIVTGCTAATQYRWLEGTLIVRHWSPLPTAIVRPPVSTTFRLEVRCGDCAGPCFAASSVVVTVDPDIVPPDLANSLRAVRKNADVDLLWASVAEARSYSLFRGLVKGMWPPLPLVEDLLAPALALPDVAVPPNDPLYFYRAAGASCSGVEGP